VVIVSHDRYLLDAVVTHIAELEDGAHHDLRRRLLGLRARQGARLARQEEFVPDPAARDRAARNAIERFTRFWAVTS
jgi:ATPase subunit of ABC transporter with duplicated ATPase domains